MIDIRRLAAAVLPLRNTRAYEPDEQIADLTKAVLALADAVTLLARELDTVDTIAHRADRNARMFGLIRR